MHDRAANPPASVALDDRHGRLLAVLRGLDRVAVAFSAGVDSTLVLAAALEALGSGRVLAVTGRSDSVPAAELEEAAAIARQLGVEHVILDTDEFDNPSYVANPENRCYFCKTTLYTHMARLLAERGFTAAVVNGANLDDLGDHRPGLAAAREYAVRSPLVEAGLTKRDVRDLSRRLDLPTSDKPAAPCLSSRIPYGQEVTPEKLRMIERAERFLRDELAVPECRVRHHDGLARIEVPPDCISRLTDRDTAARIDRHFRSLGFSYVTVDLRGFRSGSLNETLPLTQLQVSR